MAGILDEIKAYLSSTFGQQEAPPPPPINAARPWDSPVFQRPIRPAGIPSPDQGQPPVTPPDEALALAQQLIRQKEVAKRLIPEQTWNR